MSNIFKALMPIFNFIIMFIFSIIFLVISIIIGFLVWFFVYYQLNPFNIDVAKLENLTTRNKNIDLFRWILFDFYTRKKKNREFPAYGFTFYVGRQGQGKTISIVDYLIRMKINYPKCIIVTNFDCVVSDRIMTDWQDFIDIRNGTDGVIFAIDEIHTEYSTANWKDVPENLLSEISQQRKQRVKIVASAQYFGRIAKPLREQAFSVVECRTTFKGRLTTCTHYDISAYEYALNSANGFNKIKPINKNSFVQSNKLRNCYDTYAKINRMKSIESNLQGNKK